MCRYSGFVFKNDAPVLNRKNANKAIFTLKMFNFYYMDYSKYNENDRTVEHYIGRLANDLNNATSIDYGLLENTLKQINKIEHTHASNKTIKEITNYIFGLPILQFINYGLNYVGVSPYFQYIIKGLIIILAVSIDTRKYLDKR